MPVYVVTGANRGLGLEFARQLSQDKSNTVLLTSRNAKADLTDVKAATSANEKNTQFLTCDTGSLDSIKTFASQAKESLAGKKIDFLINNAGMNAHPEQTSLSMTAEALEEGMRVNVLGPAKTAELLLAQDLLAPNARIVNMSSGLGSMHVSLSITPRKCATYSITKAGVNSLTAQQSGDYREKLGKECVVIAMDPGWVKTRMGGEGAVLEPQESIGGMLKCIHGLREADNGKFYTYTGEEVPW